MQRFSKNEKILLVLAGLVTLTGIVGLVTKFELIVQIALLLLLFILVVTIALAILRIDRLAKQQRKSRQEIYQVLYWLNGSDKKTENQAKKTRDLLRKNVEDMTKLLKRNPESSSYKSPPISKTTHGELKAIDALAESERQRFNKLVALLDTQWEVLQEISEDTSLKKKSG